MNKEQKAALVKEIAERLGEAETILAVDYRGITVPQAAELRSRLRDAEATFAVVKNRLAKRAAEEAGTAGLDELLEGPTALTFVHGDVVTAAKAISSFSREHGVLAFKGGLMDGETLDEERFTALGRLPALEVMRGQLVGMTASPLTGLVRGLGSMLAGLAVALGQVQEQGLVGGGEEPPSEQPEAEEVPPPEAEAPSEEPEAPASEAAEEPVGDAGDQPAGEDSEGEETSETDEEAKEE